MNARRRAIAALGMVAGLGAVGAWAALMPLTSATNERVYVIPRGTFARRMAGEKLAILPDELRLVLGVKDVLVLENRDDVPQTFGPVLIMPGQTFRMPFHRAASYQFACSLHVSGQLTIVVEEMPAKGWERVRWRAREAGLVG